jgi:hypothetical protein
MNRPRHVEKFDSTEQTSIISIVLIDFVYGLSDLVAVSLGFGFQSRPGVTRGEKTFPHEKILNSGGPLKAGSRMSEGT